ncbi:MAG: 4-hydroxybenzoate polyprenyltransferase, partial [Synechococcaceae cyanobacterium]|nr:4-hydroxybenzoate polyprenyltransferase [Synechococcaceae cyanobacterium]
RPRTRPLADGRLSGRTAVVLLLAGLLVARLVVLALPAASRNLCLGLSLAALPPVLLYPSAKRWFPLPQLVLCLCWGFAVLIPWAAASGSLTAPGAPGGWALLLTWLATLLWTFGFDTVYAMSDRDDDRRVGVRSSALTLGEAAPWVVSGCYVAAALALAAAALFSGIGCWSFWLPWAVAALGMQREAALLRRPGLPRSQFGRHFQRQVQLGGLLLLALILGRGL